MRTVLGLGLFLLALAGGVAAELPAGRVDGGQARQYVQKQVSFGPRVPGTEAHEAMREWLKEEAQRLGWTVEEQSFETTLPLTGQAVTGHNIYVTASEGALTSPALMISAHWDTRPYADQGGERAPMAGANDGGSGVALLLELARALKDDPMREQAVLAFWDVEDAGVERNPQSWALGARYAAANPPEWIDAVVLGINLDMVGAEGAVYQPEALSLEAAPEALRSLWTMGIVMAPTLFETSRTYEVVDDHVPWIEAGLPYVDLIGWPFEHWHTVQDDMEAIDETTLHLTGNTVLEYLRTGMWETQGRTPGPLGRH